ncbi:MAG: DUF692 domain-containing protein [Deltaproteobacteria bacterium]|nr:DUF692 domain-containing protein [Deltaproteobacteria bacterium]
MSTFLGHGYGLRARHYPDLLEAPAGLGVPCVEAITENFLGRGGRPAAILERARSEAEVVLHGVSLSIGSTDPLRLAYLDALRELAERVQAKVVSDHLCFGSVGGRFGHDLWPMPLTEEALDHVVERVSRVQERLGRRIALENPSSYLEWAASTIPEEEFLSEVVRRADSLVLLDLNNVYVSARNHGFDPLRYIEAIPRGRVAQFHLAGHSARDGYLFDDHGAAVSDPVWELYERAVRRFGDVTCIVEWDSNVPELHQLVAEAARARRRAAAATQRAREVA